MSKRRKLACIISGAVVLLAVAAFATIFGRHKSRFEFLYALTPTVGEYTPTALAVSGGSLVTIGSSVGGGTVRYMVSTSSSPITAPRPQTVLLFRPGQERRVSDLLDKHRQKLPVSAFGFATSGGGDTLRTMADGKTTVIFATGQFAKDIADKAHLTFSPGASVVTISEPPDWFSARLHAVLHFLHVE